MRSLFYGDCSCCCYAFCNCDCCGHGYGHAVVVVVVVAVHCSLPHVLLFIDCSLICCLTFDCSLIVASRHGSFPSAAKDCVFCLPLGLHGGSWS